MGGCGACVVLLSKYDPVDDQVEDFTVSSCLTLLYSINGCSITTTEGLGNRKDGFHSIHQRFSGFHASQCGFCTPGICMSLFSALVNGEKIQRDGPPGFSKLTTSEAEKAVAGHLCQCTGYRPIADACKSFAADVDMEDLGLNSFWSKGESEDVKINKLLLYTPGSICTFPDFLKGEIKSKTINNPEGSCWYSPRRVEDLQNLLESMDMENMQGVKLVVGNTSTGYYKDLDCYNTFIDLRCIPELSTIRRDHEGIEIGAAVTISKAIEALKREGKSGLGSNGGVVFTKIAEHMNKVASNFIRNTASLGGKLVMAQRSHFPSDIVTILLAADSSIERGSKRQSLSLEEFLERTAFDSKTVILNIRIPSWDPMKTSCSDNKMRLMFETYRATPRPLGSALPYLNAAFLAQFSSDQASGGITLKALQLAFGAYGTKHAIRVRKVEEYLSGKFLSVDILFEAIKLLRILVVPEEGTSCPSYRSSLAVSFLFDFLRPLVETCPPMSYSYLDGYMSSSETKDFKNNIMYNKFDHSTKSQMLLSGKQAVEVSKQYHPVGEPTKKFGAEIQTSGEAVYVDDIPSPKDCLHGAFIYSTKPLACVKSISFKSGSLPNGVVRVITFKDIPEGGENIGSSFIFGSDPLFADDLTQWACQPLGFVVADTQKHANIAANCAVVEYDTKNLEPPILSVEDAVERSSFFEVPPFIDPKPIGNFSKGMAEADHKILSAEIKLGSQYYFYRNTNFPCYTR